MVVMILLDFHSFISCIIRNFKRAKKFRYVLYFPFCIYSLRRKGTEFFETYSKTILHNQVIEEKSLKIRHVGEDFQFSTPAWESKEMAGLNKKCITF